MRPNEVLTSQERDLLLRRSDVKAWLMVLRTWTLTFGILWSVAAYPSLLTFLFAWLVLPGRQLSLAVLMHEAGHGSLFKTRALNQWVGQWLCAFVD